MPEVFFSGPCGRIEGRYKHKEEGAPIALLLHPNPLKGGTMNNRVVYSMHQAFVERGFSVLRFNFRGVGRSQGEYDKGEGELADAASALDWLQSYNPNAEQTWIAGYDFGAWIAMQLLMRRPEVTSFNAISPPANSEDFSFLAPCPSSGQIIQGARDDIVSSESVDKLVEKLNTQRGVTIDYHLMEEADHYFAHDLDALKNKIGTYLRTYPLKSER